MKVPALSYGLIHPKGVKDNFRGFFKTLSKKKNKKKLKYIRLWSILIIRSENVSFLN